MDEPTLEYYEQNAATIAPGYEAGFACGPAAYPVLAGQNRRDSLPAMALDKRCHASISAS